MTDVPGDTPILETLPLSHRDAEALADMMAGGPLPVVEALDRQEAFNAVRPDSTASTTSSDRK